MNGALLLATLGTELRLRARRGSTLVVLLGVLGASWLMLGDPADGMALLVADDARIRYSSAALAFGSASLGAVLLSLAGFYLVRGRVQEDLRCGASGVLAASPAGNAALLLARWLSSVAFLGVLALALLLSTWLLHALRGEGPWQPWEYLQTYALLLPPALLLTAALALLADAWAPLMGRRGDVAYFVLWTCLLAVVPAGLSGHSGTGLPALLWFDSTGIGMAVHQLGQLLGTQNLGVGASPFNAALPLRDFPDGFWTAPLALRRLGACGLALPPLLLALVLFHRYDPGRVRARRSGGGSGRIGRGLHALQRPLRRPSQALLVATAHLPPRLASPLAELLLVLLTQPWAWLLLAAAALGAAWAPVSALPTVLAACTLAWGLLTAELGARGAQERGLGVPDALPGGHRTRLLGRALAALLLGCLLLGPLLLRVPGWALPVGVALPLLSALALLLGQWTRGGRAFLALFLFGWFVAVQTRGAGLLG